MKSIVSRGAIAAALVAFSAATTCAPGSAEAHGGDHWPVYGNTLKMGWTADGKKTKFQFKTKGQVNINPTSISEDPRVERSTLVVRGAGTNPGNTGVIVLSKSRWSPIGDEEAPSGWSFKGDPYYTDGVTKIQIKSGKTEGSLQIQAKGFYWPYEINAAQEEVEVVLSIGGNAFCAEFSPDRMATFKSDELGKVQASLSLAPGDCPAVCGNGIKETGEECDDGNFDDTDTCSNTCQGCDPMDVEYASTFEAIQDLIFDNPAYSCSSGPCHGAATEGGLDLRAGSSYAELVNVPASIENTTMRVFPGDQDLSMLWLKIAERTLGSVEAPGVGMPAGFTSPVTEDHLEALRLWIRGGAPETGVVDGTAPLLGSCLPPATPLDIPQPPVPDPSVGTQLAMPAYNLLSQTEVEGCVASYYDVSATVPPSMMVDCPGAFPGTNESGLNAGKCFSYNGNELFQDAQSHHSIVDIYNGDYDWDHSGWGPWTCYGGPNDGDPCEADVPNDCGAGGVCGGRFHNGVACLGNWGPPDYNNGLTPQFSGSQESTANLSFPDGVYNLLPLKGVVLWNSHAFNLTSEDTAMEGWINLTYTDQRSWPAIGLFENQWIFTQTVEPFEAEEYCATFTFPAGVSSHLFQLSSHTHKRGVRWRYYQAPQTPCSAPGSYTSPSCLPGDIGDMFYESYDYSDPLTLNANPIHVYSGSVEDRTIKFCALFDNGLTDPATVKTQSGSPIPTGNLPVGGPCNDSQVQCMGGANMGDLCAGNDANCPGSTCDACPLRGGVTTEDEMFIAIGTYYTTP